MKRKNKVISIIYILIGLALIIERFIYYYGW